MMDKFGSVAREAGPAINVVGKLSVQALDTLPLSLLLVLFLACLLLLNAPISSNSLLPTHSPLIADKDRLSPLPPSPPSGYTYVPSSPLSPGCFANTPQYVAVLSASVGRRSSRFREWRRSSLESVEEVDEKREEEV